MNKLESGGDSTVEAQQKITQMFSNVQSQMGEGTNANVMSLLKSASASLNVTPAKAAEPSVENKSKTDGA